MRTSRLKRGSTLALLAAAFACGCYEGRRDLAHGKHAFAVTASDVNGDRKADLVVTSDFGGELGDTLSVRLGRGDGSFEEPHHTPLLTAARSRAVVTADFDADGRLDAATANTELFNVQVFLGDQSGSFRARTTNLTPEEPQRLAVGDLDDDGVIDLAVACRDDSGAYLSLLFGHGDGDFSEPETYAGEPGTVAFGVAIGDVDGDRRLDVVTSGLAGGGRLRVHLNRGARSFESLEFIAGGLHDVALADVDGDGRLDIVSVDHRVLRVLSGRGDGSFEQVEEHELGGQPTALIVADLNADGRSEFAVARDDDRVSVFWGATTYSKRFRQDLATGSKPVSLAAADFDRSGQLDLVTANSGTPGSLTLFESVQD